MKKEKVITERRSSINFSYEIDILHSDNSKRNGLYHGILKCYWNWDNGKVFYYAQTYLGNSHGVTVDFNY